MQIKLRVPTWDVSEDASDAGSGSRMSESPKILYLYYSPQIVGPGHIKCSELLERLETDYETISLFALTNELPDNWPAGEVKKENFIFEHRFNVLIIEKNLAVPDPLGSDYRVRSKLLQRFVQSGGLVIYLSGSTPRDLPEYNRFSEEALLPRLVYPTSREGFPNLRHGLKGDGPYDREYIWGFEGGSRFTLNIDDSWVASQPKTLQGVFEGVQHIRVHKPLLAEKETGYLLEGNSKTKMLSSADLYYDGQMFFPASYVYIGKGSGILVTGGIAEDSVLSAGTSDAIQFVSNLVNIFSTWHQNKRAKKSSPKKVLSDEVENRTGALDGQVIGAIETINKAKMEPSLQEAIRCTLEEMRICIQRQCRISTICLCGRIIEACLKQVLLNSDQAPSSFKEKALNALLISVNKSGSKSAKECLPGLKEWLNVFNEYRNANVHDKSESGMPPSPSTEEVIACVNICINTINKTI